MIERLTLRANSRFRFHSRGESSGREATSTGSTALDETEETRASISRVEAFPGARGARGANSFSG